MAGEFLSVPGNIKQVFLPFVLDPNNPLNNASINVSMDNGNPNPWVQVKGETQLFSFRNMMGQNTGSKARLNIAPKSFYNFQQGIPAVDISYRLLYSRHVETKTQILPHSDILENLPRVTIREYLQDAKLDQVMNLFSEIGKAWSSGTEQGEKAKAEAENGKGFWDTIVSGAKSVWNGGSVLIRNIENVMNDIMGDAYNKAKMKTGTDDRLKKFVLQIPYLMYYKIMSATSTNVYELPYNGQVMYESNGSTGWTATDALAGYSGGDKSFLGSIANYVGKSIRINSTPTWDGAQSEQGTKITVEFTLFNDDVSAAVRNFIFINTIVPGSMWMQYHVFQHAPNLYDVRVEGVKRLFMCAGDFSVEQIGVLRRPPIMFFHKLGKHINARLKLSAKDLMDQDMIRLPDAYKVTCTFTSLLPNNFNNYLYSFYCNDKIKQAKNNNMRQTSACEGLMDNAKAELYAIFNYPYAANDEFTKNKSLKSMIYDIKTDESKVIEADKKAKDGNRNEAISSTESTYKDPC